MRPNPDAPGGIEFSSRTQNLPKQDNKQHGNNSNQRPSSRSSSFNSTRPEFVKPDIPSSRRSSHIGVDDSTIKDLSKTTENVTTNDDQSAPTRDVKQSDTIGGDFEGLTSPRTPRPYSAGSLNSPQIGTDRLSFFDRPEISSRSSDQSGSTSRIPRPPLSGASPGTVGDRLRNFQDKREPKK